MLLFDFVEQATQRTDTAEQARDSIEGELRALSVDGALDQWIGNYDLLVSGVGKLKSLSPVYDNPD
ncbi:MAG: hypothetical protein OXI80_00400 [Caldilineaceae bacterium]|nr:hypothetical protein [Caldilineaceae bacterium]MDE0336101.1 hypothetical protein [Caldilineaceae bacterium]